MAKYYVNNKPQVHDNGDHEVHREGCDFFPSDCTYLGDFSSCEPAVAAAKKIYSTADGCYHCCRPCHKG